MAKKLNEHGRAKTSEWQQIIMKAAVAASERELKLFLDRAKGAAFRFNPSSEFFSAEKAANMSRA
jgi:hypothetical protein